MTTSLARQLASLRTPGSVSSPQTLSVYSGPFLFPEAETDHSSIASLKGCVAENLSFLCTKDVSLARYSILLELEETDPEAKELVNDCLISICPHLLLKQAQWVLQWLVIKHKVHLANPGLLIYSLLPYYSYQIYQSVIQCVDTTVKQAEKGSSWLASFKKNCFPTSSTSLQKHAATDTAFFRFLCETMVTLCNYVTKLSEAKFHKQTTFFMNTIIGALENISEIGDEKVLLLLQVIFAGFKSSDAEISSVSCILLSYLLPRVSFKPKAANKLCKAVTKFSKADPNHETLYIVLLLARTQQVNQQIVLELVVSHESVINMIVNDVKNSPEEDFAETVDSVLYSLCVIMEYLQPVKGDIKMACSQEELKLIDLVLSMLGVKTILSEESCAFLAAGSVDLMKSLDDNAQNSSMKKKLEKILSHIQGLWPEVFRESMIRGGIDNQQDILFIPGVSSPSQAQLSALRILSHNLLIQSISDKLLVDVTSSKGAKKLIKQNKDDLKLLLACDTEFLLSQIESNRLECLLFNLVRISDSFPTIQELAVRHLTSSALLPSLANKSELELLLLPILYTSSAAVSAVVISSPLAASSNLLSMLSSLSTSLSTFKANVTDKLSILLSPSHLQCVLSSPYLLHTAPLVTLFLGLSSRTLKNISHDWSELYSQLVRKAIMNMNIENREESNDMESLIAEALNNSSLPWSAIIHTVRDLISNVSDRKSSVDLLQVVPSLMEKGLSDEAGQIKKSIFEHYGDDVISLLLEAVSSSSDMKLVCLCLTEATLLCSENRLGSKILKDKSDASILHILGAIFHPKSRVQKIAFQLIEKLQHCSDGGLLLPILKFLAENKTEMLNNSDNIPFILTQEKIETKACRELLARSILGPVELFANLATLFKSLTSSKDVDKIFKFGVDCLDKKTLVADNAVKEILTQFGKQIYSNLGSDIVWNFISSCLATERVVDCAGLNRKIPHLLLSSMASYPLLAQRMTEKQKTKLLAVLVKFCTTDSSVDARDLAQAADPNPMMIIEQLKEIWGQETFTSGRVAGRGKFSLLYGSGNKSEQDVEKWVQTCWLLELTEKLLDPIRDEEHNRLQLARPLFVILRKVADMEVEEGTYKLSLVLSVLLRLMNCVSDEKLQKLEPGQLDPELLVHCIRLSPSPDTRQTALQVLARCAISNPDFILQNSITIFTFMGSHLIKVDSKHSFQVACQALEVIIPAIKSACQASGKPQQLQATCLGVLTTFVDASTDIPAHRLTEFLIRLIDCLGSSEHLWVASLLLVRKDKAGGERRVIELFSKLDVARGLEALLRILVNTRNDSTQLRKMFGVRLDRKEDDATEKPDDWDVLRLRALQIVTQVLSSSNFKKNMEKELEGEDVEQMLNFLIEAEILTIQEYSKISVPMPAKLKKNLLNYSERTLEATLSLLPPSLFLQISVSLLGSEISSVRQRALEVVSSKLAPPSPLPIDSLYPLVKPVINLALTEDQPHTQQLALLAVRQLSKLLPDSQHLLPAVEAFDCSFLDRLANAKVLGAAVLSCGDILTSLGPLAIPKVPGMVTWLCEKLETESLGIEWNEKELTVVKNSFLYCIQKLVETYVGFLHPHLPRIIAQSCKLSISSTSTYGRSKMLLTSLANTVPPHNTLALSSQLLEKVWKNPHAIPPFVNFVAENCRRLERSQLSSVSKQVVELFTNALNYRSKSESNDDLVNQVEDSVITAFLSIALRLSLEDFIPVYQGLISLYVVGSNSQIVTMFHFMNKVAFKLKSLFGFGIESCILNATNILKEERPTDVVEACLGSLTTVVTYNKVDVISVVQYEELITSLLSPWVLSSTLLSPCLVQLAISTPDDTNWKFLHYQLLLLLRDSRVSIRLMVLSVLTKCVTDRTDTYLPVLPDAVPFLQEILEDDDQTVETACREFIQHMETTFGQNIESYFV